VSGKRLSEEAKIERAAYRREWNKKNPEKNKEYIARYWQRKAEKAAQRDTVDIKNE